MIARVLCIAALAALCACGQKGALVLPSSAASTASSPAAAGR